MDENPQATEIKFFDASARIGRVRYLAYPWGLLLLLLPVFILAGVTFVIHLAFIGTLLFIAAEIFALVMGGVFIVRRLHDFGYNGWWSLIYWALQLWSLYLTFHFLLTHSLGTPQPLGNYLPSLFLFAFFLVMVLVPGTKGSNRFGPMPPPNSTWVLVGAWTWLLIPVLGIAAAIAIPAYQDFIARSQTSEGIQLAGGAEVGVSEYFEKNKAWPADLASVYAAAGNDPAGRYVATVSGAGNGETYGVTSTMKSEGVNRAIAGKSLEIWTTDGGNTWHCGPGGADPVDPKYLPVSCRDTEAP